MLGEWYGWLPSSALAALIDRGHDLGWWHPGKRTAIGVLLTGVIFSFFEAWRKEHIAKQGAEKTAGLLKEQLDARRPQLSLNIENCIWFYDAQRDLTLFVIAAGLLNSGESTAVFRWRGKYQLGDNVEDMEGYFLFSPFTFPAAGGTITLTNDNLLSAQLHNTPLGRGEAKFGRLVFSVKGNRLAQVNSLQFKLIVECSDFEYTPASAVFSPASKPLENIMIFPGENAQELLPPHGQRDR